VVKSFDFHPVSGSNPSGGNFFKKSTNFLDHPRFPKILRQNLESTAALSEGERIGSVASYSDSSLFKSKAGNLLKQTLISNAD